MGAIQQCITVTAVKLFYEVLPKQLEACLITITHVSKPCVTKRHIRCNDEIYARLLQSAWAANVMCMLSLRLSCVTLMYADHISLDISNVITRIMANVSAFYAHNVRDLMQRKRTQILVERSCYKPHSLPRLPQNLANFGLLTKGLALTFLPTQNHCFGYHISNVSICSADRCPLKFLQQFLNNQNSQIGPKSVYNFRSVNRPS